MPRDTLNVVVGYLLDWVFVFLRKNSLDLLNQVRGLGDVLASVNEPIQETHRPGHRQQNDRDQYQSRLPPRVQVYQAGYDQDRQDNKSDQHRDIDRAHSELSRAFSVIQLQCHQNTLQCLDHIVLGHLEPLQSPELLLTRD